MARLWIPAASPLFIYSPSSLTPDNLQGDWTGTLAQNQPAGAGNQTASTLQQSGAVLLPSIYSSEFSPVFSPQTGWSVSLGVNSEQPQPWAPGQIWRGDKLAPNTFLLQFECTTADCSGTPIIFGGATATTQYTADGQTRAEAVLDDASAGRAYAGDFTELAGGGGNATVGITSEDHEGTLSWTGTAGASVTVTFQGASIAAYGVTGPSLGTFGVTIDGNRVSTLSANSDVDAHGILLYFATLLDPETQHTIMLEALDSTGGAGTVGLVVDRWQAWGLSGKTSFSNATSAAQPSLTPAPSSTLGPAASSTVGAIPASGPINNGTDTAPAGAAVDNSGPNVGAIVGGVIGGLAALALLYFMFRKVHKALKPEDKKLNAWDEANMLQNVKNEGVHVTTVANQRYVYHSQAGMIAHPKLK